jgi:hypothetical protein
MTTLAAPTARRNGIPRHADRDFPPRGPETPQDVPGSTHAAPGGVRDAEEARPKGEGPEAPETSNPTAPETNDTAGHTCRLVLTIAGTDYAIRPMPNDQFGARGRAWRLRKIDASGIGATYVVWGTVDGPLCSCPDAHHRHNGRQTCGCKHIKALRALNLID